MLNIKTVIAVAVATGAAIAVARKFFSKKVTNRTGVIKDKSWVEKTEVERFEEVTESGWTVPDGAFDVTSERRLKKAIRPSSFDGAREFVSDVMNATYATYYTYKIRRWVSDGVITRRGNDSYDHSVDHVEDLCLDISNPQVGQRRVAAVHLRYNILVVDDETGEFVSITTEGTYYDCVSIGQRVSYYRSPLSKRLLGTAYDVDEYDAIDDDDNGSSVITDEDSENA